MFNKRKIIGIGIILILIFSVSFTYWYVSNKEREEDKYMNVKEFLQKYGISENITDKQIIYIKDTPIKMEIIKLPNITYPIPIWSKFPPSIDVDSVIFYTNIYFKSNSNDSLLFIGNRTKDFPIGKEIIFSLPVKEYYLETYGMSVGSRLTIEPIYNLFQFLSYNYLVETKIFMPLNFTFEIIENNTKMVIKVTNTTDFYPLPRKWSEVNEIVVRSDEPGGMIIKYLSEIKVYDLQGKLVGTIGKDSNITNDKFIEKNDYLIFDYYDYYSKSYIKFYTDDDVLLWWVHL